MNVADFKIPKMITESHTLIPKNIKLTAFPIRRTLRWTTDEGIKMVRRNQIAVKVEFEGEYENTFVPGCGYHSQNGIALLAVTDHKLVLINNVMPSFTLPAFIVKTFSAHREI